jgi:hypothetical protein
MKILVVKKTDMKFIFSPIDGAIVRRLQLFGGGNFRRQNCPTVVIFHDDNCPKAAFNMPKHKRANCFSGIQSG